MEKEKVTLAVRSLGLLWKKSPKNILRAHGLALRAMGRAEAVLNWGRGPTTPRARKLASKKNLPLWTAEDGFLRSLYPGRSGDPSRAVILDESGVHYDPKSGSDVHKWMRNASTKTEAEAEAAATGLKVLKDWQLSKYNAFHLDDAELPQDFVLVIDQVRGDASIKYSGVDAQAFEAMLMAAVRENPNVQILIKTHPETRNGHRKGYFMGGRKKGGLIAFYDKPVSPWLLFSRARKVYTVSSQMGMEAIFAGHRPVVFGRPFYAGWGLTDDRHPEEERRAWRTAEDLFWAAYLKSTLWYDPIFDEKSDFFTTCHALRAEADAWRKMERAKVLFGFRLWKRGFLRGYARLAKTVPFFTYSENRALQRAKTKDVPLYRWGKSGGHVLERAAARLDVPVVTVEDGFIRSRGLGAELRQPYSLIFDDLGIYFDAGRPSRLEQLITDSVELPEMECARAADLRTDYVDLGVSKYNLKAKSSTTISTAKKSVLVLGQVADDASIEFGAGAIKSNDDLLWAVRQEFPKAHVVFKPHPDVVAGLRSGGVTREVLRATTDQVINHGDVATLISQVDVVATISSLGGFEALLHGKEVVCFGAPFYAGWGLTKDLGKVPDRREARPSLDQLTHAVLIDYPNYWDPVTERPCTPEVVLRRFAQGQYGRVRPINRSLARLQSLFSGFSYLWR